MCGQLDQSAFVHEHGVVRFCDERQGGRRVRPTYLLFEHAFTLREPTDIYIGRGPAGDQATDGALGDPDQKLSS